MSAKHTESNERLSALLDGELMDAELEQLLSELETSDALRARWQRMCVAQAARKGVQVTPKVDISAGVMAAIAGAPAPARDTRVVPLPLQRSSAPARMPRREWLPAMGLAAAASLVAAVAVTSLRTHAPGATSAIALAPAASNVQAVTAVADAAQLDAEAARQLDNLVIEHANYRGGGVGGALGYARVAAHTADYQTVNGQH
jgi:negative regulator of sigma E activity